MNNDDRQEPWHMQRRALWSQDIANHPYWSQQQPDTAGIWAAIEQAYERLSLFQEEHPAPTFSLIWPHDFWVQYIRLLIEYRMAQATSAPTRESIVNNITDMLKDSVKEAVEEVIWACIQDGSLVRVFGAEWWEERLSLPPPPAPQLKPSERFAILKRDDYQCRLCGVRAHTGSAVTLHVDHRIPRSRGGTNDPDNLWTLCAECNRGKGISEL